MAKRLENRSEPNRAAVQARKLIAFDAETWHALRLLSTDSMKSLQELAEEAFADLLKKHGRPVGLQEALKESLRRRPANDPRPKRNP
jgi:hypothetical protein